MNRISNRNASEYVRDRIPFKGNNLHAELREDGTYVVYSYGRHWPLFFWDGTQWFGNMDSYSRTTARHYAQAHPLCEGTDVSCEDIKKRVNA